MSHSKEPEVLHINLGTQPEDKCVMCGGKATWYLSSVLQDPHTGEIHTFKEATKKYYCDECKEDKEDE